MNGLQPGRVHAKSVTIDIAGKQGTQWFHVMKSLTAILA